MKKFILAAAAVLAVSCLSAEEDRYGSLGLHFAVPVTIEKGTASGIKAKTDITSVGFGIHTLDMFNHVIGLYAGFDVFFPENVDITMESSYGSYHTSMGRSDYGSLWGLGLFAGPAFKLVWNQHLLFTVAPGFHYQMMHISAPHDTSTSLLYLMGIGADLQTSILIGSHGYIMLGVNGAYDFSAKTDKDGTVSSGDENAFAFTPRIGAGIRF